ncbi:hypothetical protein Aperf_G00000111677 [Anoplocephala perfoliata]
MRELLTPTAPVVIDPGSYRWRVGFANMKKPKSSFITETAMLDGTAIEENGRVASFQSTELSLAYYERYLNHGFRFLNCDPHSVSLCLALPLGFPLSYRNQLAEVLFESVGVNSIFFASQSLLSGFSSRKPTCLIIDSGYSYTSLYGMNDLYPERSTELIYSIGGRDIDAYLRGMTAAQLKECTSADINYIKSQYCSVSPKSLSETVIDKGSKNKESCQLPDGHKIKLGLERQLAPELLFNPQVNGIAKLSMKEAIMESVSRLTEEKSRKVLRNIIFSGGNSKLKGLQERLQAEMPDSQVLCHPQGELAVWRGGAIFASMTTFDRMKITKNRWIEHGELIIQKKWL